MDLNERNELAIEIEKVLTKRLKKREFYAIIAVEGEGDGFSFPITTLNELTPFQSCRLIVNGIGEEAQTLLERFKIPSDAKFKKPIEPK